MTEFAGYALLPDHAIHHWLACGVVTSPLDQLDDIIPPEGNPFGSGRRWILNYWAWHPESDRIKRRIYDRLPPFGWAPEGRPVHGGAGIAGHPWRYVVAEEDQTIDFSRFNFTPTLMQGWLYAAIDSRQAMEVDAELLTIGPARVWLNGEQVTHFSKRFSYVAPQFIPVRLSLKPGLNDLYLHGEMLGWREARLALGMRFIQAHDVEIMIPIGEIPAVQWQQAEAALNRLQVRQFAFPRLPGEITLDAYAPQTVTLDVEIGLPVPKTPWAMLEDVVLPRGTARITLAPGDRADLPITPEVAASMSGIPGENTLELVIRPADGTPLALHREIWAGSNTYSSQPYGDYESRRQEALLHLAAMPYDVPSAMAALALGRITTVPSEAVALACGFMEDRCDCADFYSIGLLALLYWWGDKGVIQGADQARIEAAFRGFKYWLDEPGLDAMCYFTENHQILFHVTAYLAGQLWPTWTFTNSGRSGRQQQERARPRIENWILRRLQGSFSEWDSNAYMTLDAFAMLALTEFAESPRLREMATALLHKLFFMIACQSFRGTHGSTHGRCYVAGLKSARVENTSSLQRIAWGMGIFNGETRAAGLLAMAKRYRVPDVIQQIGADVTPKRITRARSHAQFRPQFDMRGDAWDVQTITERTGEYMLSAAIEYHPGEFGIQEHLWQATLGPEAVVFTTYPGNSQEHGNARPNFWSGSARLPQVTMWENNVLCLYRFEPNVGLGFSHAYFPTAMFDEWRLDGQWAFARVGQGYVGLWGDSALHVTGAGPHVGQELRTSGSGHAWVCRADHALNAGSFETFCERLRTASPTYTAAGARLTWQMPEGQRLEAAWGEALHVDGVAFSPAEFPHYANAYTHTPMQAETMTISAPEPHGLPPLTLDLRRGKVIF